jgi:hypothetical protein
VVYWLIAFRETWRGVLALPIWAALTAAFVALISRPRLIGLMSRLVWETGKIGEIMYIVLSILIVFALLYVSVRLERVIEPIVYDALTSLFGATHRAPVP